MSPNAGVIPPMRSSLVLFLVLAASSGGCGSTASSGSSGSSSTNGSTDSSGPSTTADAGPATSVVCTSGSTWMSGDRGSTLMHPGRACIGCHDAEGGPRLSIAGTVYPSSHEPDDCDGARGTQVIITDAAGQTVTLTTNAAGNFYSTASLTFPINAKVVANGAETAMGAAQSNGDCNSCHTVTGTSSAPGRIVSP